MKRWALIRGKQVINVVVQGSAPVGGGQWVDITGLAVGPGFNYDGVQFAAPVETVRLSVRDFLRRWTVAEREALENAIITGSAALKRQAAAFRTYLLASPDVELNDPYIVTSLAAFETANILAPGGAARILS